MKEKQLQEEKSELNAVEEKGEVTLRKIGFVLVCTAGAVLLLLALFISFLQFNTFTVKEQSGKGLSNYLLSKDALHQFTVKEGTFYLEVPAEEINAELMRIALEKESDIYNLEYDIAEKKAWVNYKRNGFFFPIRYELKPEEGMTRLRYEVTPKAMGSIGLPLPRWFFKLIESFMQSPFPGHVEVPEESFLKRGWELKSWQEKSGKVALAFSLSTDNLDEIVGALNQQKENQVRFIYEHGTAKQKQTLKLLENYPDSREELKSQLIDSYFEKESSFQDFLLLLDGKLMEEMLERYSFVKAKYDLNELLRARSELIAKSISGYGKEIIQSAKAWMDTSGGEFYNNGYPFLKKSLKTVTIKEVIQTWNLLISDNISKDIHFGVDRADNQLTVLYKVDNSNYAVIKEDGYVVVDDKTYLARYYREFPAEGEFTKSAEVWTEIVDKIKESLNTKEVFVRYMKDDGKDAFVLLSFLEKPQDVQAITFSKIEDKWQPTASNFKNITELQSHDESFNLNLYTDSYEEPKLIYIDDNALDNIKEELSYAGKLPSGVKPIYYSYKDKYIYVKLSNGEDYILTTYHQYLDKIYTREYALSTIKEYLPEIILLQEEPEGVKKEEEKTEQ